MTDGNEFGANIEESHCKHCSGTHERGHLTHRHGVWIMDVMCPQGPRAGTDDAVCYKCDQDATGETIARITDPREGHENEGLITLCQECFTAFLEGLAGYELIARAAERGSD